MKRLFYILIIISLTACATTPEVPNLPLIIGSTGNITKNYYAYYKKNTDITATEFIKRDSNGNLAIFSSGKLRHITIHDRLVVVKQSGGYIKIKVVGENVGYWVPEGIFEAR